MFKEMVSDFKEFRVWLFNWLFYRRQSIKMSLAMKLADIKQRAYNKRYHVMLLDLPGGDKLVSVNRDDIERFRRKKWLPKKIGMIELENKSIFYSTPLNRNNKSTQEERAKAKEKYLKYAKKNRL